MAARLALRPHRQLRLRDHHPHDRLPHRAAPARHQADQVDAGHAGPATEDQGDPEEVQGEQAEGPRADDEALSGVRGEPAWWLPAPPPAVPHPHRDVLGHPGTRPPARRPRRLPAWSSTTTTISPRTRSSSSTSPSTTPRDALPLHEPPVLSAAGRARRSPSSTPSGSRAGDTLDCGDSTADRIPYFVHAWR